MPKVESHAQGTFCWIDLATNDTGKARKFYTELFGWRAEDAPMPGEQGGVYTMLYKGDAMVGALYELNPDMKAAGVPPHWESYIAVDDVDAAAAKVEQLGGRINAPPFDIPGVGRMAAVADPDGAAFNLYKAAGEAGLQLVNEPGAYCWSELYAKNPSRATEFYGSLLGWRSKESVSSDGRPYYQLGPSEEQAIAGMMELRPEWGAVPPNWSLYFQVSNLDESLEKAKSLGANVLMPVTNIQGVGKFSLVSDPTGAAFLMIEMTS